MLRSSLADEFYVALRQGLLGPNSRLSPSARSDDKVNVRVAAGCNVEGYYLRRELPMGRGFRGVLYTVTLILFSSPALDAFTITRNSASVVYLDTGKNLAGHYAAYQITNTGVARDDVWVGVDSFAGGVVTLATNEDGIIQLGAMASGETKTAFVYLVASGATTTAQTHVVSVYSSRPPGVALASQGFSLTSASTISANANKVSIVVADPDPGTLGSLLTIQVTGATGTIGAAKILSFNPASFPDWPADAYRLETTSIVFSGGNTGTFTDTLLIPSAGLSTSNTDYVATYTFRASRITTGDTPVSPVAYISSGTQVKHTSTGNFADLPPVQPATNVLTMSKSAAPSAFAAGGTATYTVTVTNSGALDSVVQDFSDTLPTSPASVTYQTGTSTFAGSAIGDPTQVGSTLTWVGAFSVPAGGTASLTYQVTIPSTIGTYTNSVVGHIGSEQIDASLDTTNSAPATTPITVGTDTDGDTIEDAVDLDDDNDGIPDATEGTGDSDGDGIADSLDLDSDDDGIVDLVEAGGVDADGDGQVDGFTDINGDGLDDTLASSPLPVPNSDGDAVADYLDVDSDGDGIVDNVESHTTAAYTAPLGSDTDGDGLDDAYDTDDGGTAIVLANTDGAGNPDHLDTDTDGDGVPDAIEGHDADMDGAADRTAAGADADGDGLDDNYDTVSGPGVGNETGSNADLQNSDGAGERDWRDTDDDEDGTPTSGEDGNSNGNFADDDADSDGTPDYLDATAGVEVNTIAVDENGGDLQPGDVITYTITVSKLGTSDATNALLQAAIPSNASYVSGSTTLNGASLSDVAGTSALVDGAAVNSPGDPSGTISGGDSAVLTFQVVVAADAIAGTLITAQAFLESEDAVSGPLPTEPSDDPSTNEDNDPTTLVVGSAPALVAIKTSVDDDGGSLEPGDTITYSIEIRNEGSSDASDVVFVDSVPNLTSYVSASIVVDSVSLTDADDSDVADFGISNANAVTVRVASISSGDNVNVTFRVTVNGAAADGAVVSNQGEISSSDASSISTDDNGDPSDGAAPTRMVVGAVPALRLTKQATDLNGGEVQPGDTIEYRIEIENFGAADAAGIVLTDPLSSPDFSYVAGSTTFDGQPQADVSGLSPLVGGLPIATLAAGSSGVVRLRVVVDGSLAAGATIDNQAAFTATGGLAGVSDSSLDDGSETGNDAGDANDDDVTRVQVGGAPGTGVISGTVFLDVDHDRTADSGEPQLTGWIVELVSASGQVLASVPSDADGAYQFLNVPPAPDYQIHFRHPETNAVFGAALAVSVDGGASSAEVDLPLDPSGVVYDAVTRDPVPGAIVRLEGPLGFDPSIHVLPGQQGQTTPSDGIYRFDLLPGFPAGEYQIVVEPPTGYLSAFPSSLIPPRTDALDPTGLSDPLLVVPSAAPPTEARLAAIAPSERSNHVTYYVRFDLSTGDPQVVNNHVPLDPALSTALVVTKTTPLVNVKRGDLVPYTIEVTNTVASPVVDVDLQDRLPPGFKYVRSSASLDGSPLEPAAVGRDLSWTGLSFAANQSRQLRLVLVVGAGVSEGKYVNLAWVLDGVTGLPLSNVGDVAVNLVPDPVFDFAEIIGKVFDDRNGDGQQDDGEPGIPGVRIASARGLLITTDEHGRYHLTAAQIPHELRGSNFILKLDPRSLPSGFRMTTENPRVVRLTRGKVTKANFGVSLSRVVSVELTREAFEPNEARLAERWTAQLRNLVKTLAGAPSVLRVAYRAAHGETRAEVERRLDDFAARVHRLWEAEGDLPTLSIEEKIVWVASTPAAQEARMTADATSARDEDSAATGVDSLRSKSDEGSSGLEGGRSGEGDASTDSEEDSRSVLAPPPSSIPPPLPDGAGEETSRAPQLDAVLEEPDEPRAAKLRGKQLDSSRVVRRSPALNTEDAAPRADGATTSATPFRVSVEGFGDEPASPGDKDREADRAFAESGVQMRYDSLVAERILNVTPWPDAGVIGQTVSFQAFSNYAHFIERGEVRIFRPGISPQGKPVAVLPLDATWKAEWIPQPIDDMEVNFVVRVYDEAGRYDETVPRRLPLARRDHTLDSERDDAPSLEEELLAGYGQNHLDAMRRNIQVNGGTVTVNGSKLPPEVRAFVRGVPVPVDRTGRFVAQQIFPSGTHAVEVELRGNGGDAIVLRRNVYVPEDDWFVVAIGDLTVGGSVSNGDIEEVTQNEDFDDSVRVDGRAAFYLKGKIRGRYLLTASLDTSEDDIENIFRNLSDRDPRQLLRRLDPDRFYPVYGDDSTVTEDAPTQGRFYVKLEAGDSYVMWGNYITEIVGTDLAQVDRGLYGARLHWVSESATAHGERRTRADGFVATPDSVQVREEHRGTGGSLYYLQHQDITLGSERVRVEVRDKDSGLVLATKNLIPNQDYDIDPLQGRVLLTRPLPSNATDGLLVSTSGLSGHPVILVVRYEFVPTAGDVDELAIGGRASHWVNDHLELGVTASHQQLEGFDQDLAGADVTLRLTPESYLKAEVAVSDGAGAGEMGSIDGGFSFGALAPGMQNREALSWRVEGASDLQDITASMRGATTFYFERRQAGFSAPGKLTPSDTNQWGASLELPISDVAKVAAKYDEFDQKSGVHKRNIDGSTELSLTEHVYARAGARHDWLDGGVSLSGFSIRGGSRTDVAGRLGWRSEEDWDVYAFGQVTAHRTDRRSPNNRYGGGATLRLTRRLEVGSEVSGGNGGVGGRVSSDFQWTDRTNVYLAYQLDADRTDTGYGGRNGTMTTGMRMRYSDALSVFGEERVHHGDVQEGMVHAYGVDLAPADRWTLGVTFENGTLQSRDLFGEFERTAVTGSIGYDSESLGLGTALQWRRDLGGGVERQLWLVRNNARVQLSDDWRALVKFNFSTSHSNQGSFFSSDFTEAVLGLAYRPVASDRLNALFKYTYFRNVPSPGQIDAFRQALDFSQRSHVLSADATYDLVAWLSVGGKYAFRISELRASKTSGPWFSSMAHLVVGRLDFHIVRNWDAILEGRALWVDEAEDLRVGALAGIYRHFGDHFKFGVGYNFADFSDDLTDLSYDHHGIFVNVIGKY